MNLDEAMYTFGTGENFHLQNYLGVHELEGEEGFVFRVWAPHAEQIQVIGDDQKPYRCLGGDFSSP